jgi:hypothetical protein
MSELPKAEKFRLMLVDERVGELGLHNDSLEQDEPGVAQDGMTVGAGAPVPRLERS